MCELSRECKERFDRIDSRLDELFDRLFIGNGKPAWDVRIDRIEQKARSLTWFICSITIALIGVGAKLLYDYLA